MCCRLRLMKFCSRKLTAVAIVVESARDVEIVEVIEVVVVVVEVEVFRRVQAVEAFDGFAEVPVGEVVEE